MASFTNILVPFDGSEAAKRALDAAIGIAADKAVITLLQAADQPNAADPTAVVAERMAGVIRSEAAMEQEVAQYWESIDEALARVAKEAQEQAGEGVEIRTVVKGGNPAAIITNYAKANDVDIIVMGRRGLGSVRAMLGSVSQRVAHETDLPLLLVR